MVIRSWGFVTDLSGEFPVGIGLTGRASLEAETIILGLRDRSTFLRLL
jgi:hypothetical protein